MIRSEHVSKWRRVFFAAPARSAAPVAPALPRRCPECTAPYDPARRHYCAVCAIALPEWRYG